MRLISLIIEVENDTIWWLIVAICTFICNLEILLSDNQPRAFKECDFISSCSAYVFYSWASIRHVCVGFVATIIRVVWPWSIENTIVISVFLTIISSFGHSIIVAIRIIVTIKFTIKRWQIANKHIAILIMYLLAHLITKLILIHLVIIAIRINICCTHAYFN